MSTKKQKIEWRKKMLKFSGKINGKKRKRFKTIIEREIKEIDSRYNG